MKLIVIGGSGLIGSAAALHLESLGHDVTVASRRQPRSGSAVAGLPFLPIDYLETHLPDDLLVGFEALVFAAGHDPRQAGAGDDDYWERVNVAAIPRFFALARRQGVRRAINIGSFYPWVLPSLVETNAYVRSRLKVDEAVRALNTADFAVICLNPPYILGHVAGVRQGSFLKLVDYAKGNLPSIPRYAPSGGVNFMTTRSLSEAIAGAIHVGEAGRSYLIGDENLTFHAYFTEFFRAIDDSSTLPVRDETHPLIGSFAGIGGAIHFEPDEDERRLLGYRRQDVSRAIREITDHSGR